MSEEEKRTAAADGAQPDTDERKKQEKNSKDDDAKPTWRMPWLLRKWLGVVDMLSSTFLGGPRCIKFAHVVNFQKGGTLFLCLLLMRQSGNYSATATTYTALHGSYGLCWLLKELAFPDPKWEPKITIGSALASFGMVLAPYWGIAYNAIARKPAAERSNSALCGATIVYALGLCLMFGADCQKYFTLRAKKGLITDGFFKLTRHPNYLGEMMIYGSFAYVSSQVSSWLVLGWVWTGLFLPYMLRKEERMSRHPGWALYRAQTGFLLPWLLPQRSHATV